MASERYFIGPGLKDKIREVIYRVDEIPRVERAARVPSVEQELYQPRSRFRICTFTGSWSIGSAKTVTFKNQTNTPNTATVQNLFWPVPDGPQRDCAIAREGTAWYLLVPRLYAADAATAATITTASLEFKTLPVAALATSGTAVFSVSISTCGTATATP